MLNSLTDDTARAVAVALVQSRLDYGNSILYGITKFNLTKLQQVQNSVARIVLRHHPNFSSTDLIRELHWLPIEKRIKLKLATITYNAFYSHQPPYLFSPLSTCLQLHTYPMLHQPTSSRHSQMQNWVWQTRVQLLRSFSLVRNLCQNSICPFNHYLQTSSENPFLWSNPQPSYHISLLVTAGFASTLWFVVPPTTLCNI